MVSRNATHSLERLCQSLAIGGLLAAAQTGCVGGTPARQFRAAEGIAPVVSAPAPGMIGSEPDVLSPAHDPHLAGAASVASVAGQGMVVRWHDRMTRPVRIRVESAPAVAGWSSSDRELIQDAVTGWEGHQLPVQFVVLAADDTTVQADVVVHWVDRFSTGVCGWTTVSWTNSGDIQHGEVQLALRAPNGRRLTRDERRVLATHEFGHVLGLGHSSDPTSIMANVIYATQIAPADVASIQWLYAPAIPATPAYAVTE